MKITIIGVGNVGAQLTKRLYDCGHTIVQIYTHTQTEKAASLAQTVQSRVVASLQNLEQGADVYILAVKDDAIANVAAQISYLNTQTTIIAHTSGATPQSVFEPYFDCYGVFYPLQTFSIKTPANFEELPFCVDSNTEASFQKLYDLAKSICPNVHRIDDTQRGFLHVGAVLVNNFTNHLFDLAQTICTEQGISFDTLKPLIRETVRKIEQHRPYEMQTGAARRHDQQTIQRHLDLLTQYPDTQAIYKLLTESIEKRYK